MKTKVRIKGDVFQGSAKNGDIGYIDGYVRCRNNLPLAAIIIKDSVCLVPIYQLQVLTPEALRTERN